MIVCTCIASNFLAHARVLAESLLEHNPDAHLVALVVDAPAGESLPGGPFEIVSPVEIVERDELHRMALMYGTQELLSALKGRLMERLLLDGAPAVLLLDADICVYDRLDDVIALARERGLVLTPSLHDPANDETGYRVEAAVVRAGVFNGGALAVGLDGLPFLRWWNQRTARHSIVALEESLLMSQSWLSLVPTFFDYALLRDRGCNLTGWHLRDRDIEWNGERPTIEGVPIRFFHFTGQFDPRRPEVLSPPAERYDWPGWSSPARRPGLERLCREYAARLLGHGYLEAHARRPAYTTLASGLAIDAGMRWAYRDALLEAERVGGPEPPNPFDSTGDGRFLDWLREPVGDADPPVSRYMFGFRSARIDLRAVFPLVPGEHNGALREWFERAPSFGETIPRELLE